jgi:hypothetical protein
MKTSLTEITHIENFLHGNLETGDRLVFEARILTDHSLSNRVISQQNLYTIVNHYGREKLRLELEELHQKLFTDPKKISFRERILRIFH